MCLGIPGEIVAMVDEARHLASVDVAGVRRNVNVGLLVEEGIGRSGIGDATAVQDVGAA